MSGNPFSITPANYNVQPLLTGIGAVMKENRAERQKQIETQEITDAISSNNPDMVADLMIKYPDRQKEIVQGANYRKGVTDKVMVNAYRQASVDPANGSRYMQEAIDKVTELGGKPDNLRQSLQMFNANPEQAAKLAKVAFASLDSKGYKALRDQQGGGDQPDWMGAKTFAVGAPGGKMQRSVLDESGNLVNLGEPYDPRNPYLDTGTGFVNPNEPDEIIKKNLARAEFEKKEGVANQKFYDNYLPETQSIEGLVTENNTTKELLNELSGLTNSSTAGFGKWLSSTPMTDANYVNELKGTIQSRLAMTKMMALKAASSTGSTGFGALSEKELKLLTDFQGSLELAQDPKDIKKVIMRIYNSLEASNRGLESKLKLNKSKYGRLVKKYGKPDEASIPQQPVPQGGGAPQSAIDFLSGNPQAADQFKAKYGYLP